MNLNYILLGILLACVITGIASAEESCNVCHYSIAKNFSLSLHHTIAGMYKEWEKGVGKEFGIDLPAGCTKCHIDNCTTCHEDYGGYPGAHYNRSVEMEKCVECHHGRVGVNYVGYLGGHKEKGPNPDVHYVAGLNCTDCHTFTEIHGDGKAYDSQKKAVKIRCEDCHLELTVVKGKKAKLYSSNIPAHRIHEDKLECSACHAGWIQTCYNCHLETKKIDSTTVEKYYLGVGYEGKVKPFYRMVVSYGNRTFEGWVEYTPHTTWKAKDCKFCHLNKELLGEGRTGVVLGPEGASFIPKETIDRIYGITAPKPTATVTTPTTPKPTATVTTIPTTTATVTKPTPGFEVVFAILGLGIVLLARKIM